MLNKKTVESRDLKQGLGYQATHSKSKAAASIKVKKLKKEDLITTKNEEI